MGATNDHIHHIRTTALASAVVLLAMTLTATPAPAANAAYQYSFLFTVPVQVSNLSVYAKQVRLICAVKDANGNWLTSDFSVGGFSNDIAAVGSNGAFSGTLTRAVRLMNPSDASKAKSYWCSIQPGSGSAFRNFEDCDADTAFFCLKPGSARMLAVEGAIP